MPQRDGTVELHRQFGELRVFVDEYGPAIALSRRGAKSSPFACPRVRRAFDPAGLPAKAYPAEQATAVIAQIQHQSRSR